MPISEELGYADLVNDKQFENYLRSVNKEPAEEKARILEEKIRDEAPRVIVMDKTFEVFLQSLDELPAEEKARILEEKIRDERPRVKREQAEKTKHNLAKAVIGLSCAVLLFFSLAFFWNFPFDQTTVVVNVTDYKILSACGIVVGVGWIWFQKPDD